MEREADAMARRTVSWFFENRPRCRSARAAVLEGWMNPLVSRQLQSARFLQWTGARFRHWKSEHLTEPGDRSEIGVITSSLQ